MFRYFLTLPLLVMLFVPLAFADDGTVKIISNTAKDSISPTIAVEGKNIFVSWIEHSRSGSSEMFFSKSTDSGETFGEQKRVIAQQGSPIDPTIITDGTDLYITWTYRYPNSYSGTWSDDNSEIHISKSTDGGETFGTPLKINDVNSFSSVSEIAVGEKNVFVTWFNHQKSPNDVFFSKSTDGGETFTPPRNISDSDGSPNMPSIATNGTDIFLVWSDEHEETTGIFFSKSTDGGETFGEPSAISSEMDYSDGPVVATDGANIYVVWTYHQAGKNDDILFSKSTDGGTTFTPPQNISNDSGNSVSPSIVTNGTDVFVAWTDSHVNSSYILLAKSTDGGETFGEPQNISDNAGFASSQSLAIDGNNIFTVWSWAEDMHGYPEIFFSKSAIVPSAYSVDQNDNNAHNKPVQNNQTDNSGTVEEMVANTAGTIEWLEDSATIGGIGMLKIVDPDMDKTELVDIFTAFVWSDTDKEGIELDMVESGRNTGEFYIDVSFTSEESSIQSLQVSSGDLVTALYQDVTVADELKPMIEITDTIEIVQEYVSPFEQLAVGVPLDNILCSDDSLRLFVKDDNTPLCLRSSTFERLVDRGYFE